MVWTQMALATVQCCLETDDSELDPAEMVQNKLESPGTDNIWPTTGYYMYLLAYSCPLSRTQKSRWGRWTQKNWWLPPGPTKTSSLVYWTMSLWTVWALDLAIVIWIYMCGNRVRAFSQTPPPIDSTPGSEVGIQRAWRQPGNGQLLHIHDVMLQDPANNRVSTLY